MKRAIEEAKKMLEEIEVCYAGYWCWEVIARYINELIERLEKLPEEPTLEELLEEMEDGICIEKMSNTNYWAYTEEKKLCYSGHWQTPRLALLALREKLSIK